MSSELVEYIIIGVTAFALILDVYLALDKRPGNTISQVMRRDTKKYPLIAFAWGLLMGHWYW